ADLPVLGGEHPVQSIGPLRDTATAQAHDALARRGVRVVPQKLRCRPGSALTFLITVRHRGVDIDDAVAAVDHVLRGGSHGWVA
ncbi:MAG: hypothetical protein M3Q48_17440, partial [Actinomycetota bacterium]|nr:hypothetical protein [Actinomycetota bacterium]